MLSFLYRGHLYVHILFDDHATRTIVAVIGVITIFIFSAGIIWCVEMSQRRYGSAGPRLVWLLSIIILYCIILPINIIYKKNHCREFGFPDINIVNKPDILLITLDTLRADHLACYGNSIVQTPNLDALAQSGYLFEAAFSQSPYTTPSHCSIMTATYPTQHGAFNGSAMTNVFPTIAEILRAYGYDTAAFVSSSMVRSGNSGLHHGFNYYEDSLSPYSSFFRHDECQFLIVIHYLSHLQQHQIPGCIVTKRFLAWLNNKSNSPFFCWLHYFDPHTPYDAPEPYKNMYDGKINPALPRLLDRIHYAGEVTYTDTQLGNIINTLKQNNIYDNTLIIVTADHGEAFGEKHGSIVEYGHGSHLYDTTQNVPLIIKLPGQNNTSRRINNVVQLIDLAPTIMDYLNVTPPESFKGNSLLELLNGSKNPQSATAYAERTPLPTTARTDPKTQTRLMAIRTKKIKYICDMSGKRQELYDIDTDPAETINIYTDKPDMVLSYYHNLINTLGEKVNTKTFSLDPQTLKQLESLGYIGDGWEEP